MSDTPAWSNAVKDLAHELDPECWESYSGAPINHKRRMEARRLAALETARARLGNNEQSEPEDDKPASIFGNRLGFPGVVYLKDWFKYSDGRQYISIAGKISLLTDVELTGFKTTRGNESNWCAMIQGSGCALSILGCQIRAIEARANMPRGCTDVLMLMELP